MSDISYSGMSMIVKYIIFLLMMIAFLAIVWNRVKVFI